MSWYDRKPAQLIALLTAAVWGGALVLVSLAFGLAVKPLAVALVAALGAVFALRERKARRRAGLAL